MENEITDEVIEISSKSYQKLENSIEKEGYREGKSHAADKIFQNSFDNGYEDGFKMGFLLGKLGKKHSKMGGCQLCKDKSLLTSDKAETEIRKLVGKNYEDEAKRNN